jgi:hypothetical protein
METNNMILLLYELVLLLQVVEVVVEVEVEVVEHQCVQALILFV